MICLIIDGNTNDSNARGSPKKLMAHRSFGFLCGTASFGIMCCWWWWLLLMAPVVVVVVVGSKCDTLRTIDFISKNRSATPATIHIHTKEYTSAFINHRRLDGLLVVLICTPAFCFTAGDRRYMVSTWNAEGWIQRILRSALATSYSSIYVSIYECWSFQKVMFQLQRSNDMIVFTIRKRNQQLW